MQVPYQWSMVVGAHAVLAAIAVVLGGVLLAARKGQRFHRVGGWIWVVCMAGVAGTSFAIHGPNGYSWIHALSAITLVSLLSGIVAARRHGISTHRRTMQFLYFGGLVAAGVFTLLPGRLIGRAVWSWFS